MGKLKKAFKKLTKTVTKPIVDLGEDLLTPVVDVAGDVTKPIVRAVIPEIELPPGPTAEELAAEEELVAAETARVEAERVAAVDALATSQKAEASRRRAKAAASGLGGLTTDLLGQAQDEQDEKDLSFLRKTGVSRSAVEAQRGNQVADQALKDDKDKGMAKVGPTPVAGAQRRGAGATTRQWWQA